MSKKGGEIFVFILLIAISGFFYTQIALADTPGVMISEICWMGDEESSSHEWIELENKTDEDINLDGWVLAALDGSPNIALAGSLPALSYFLLERTSDESVPEVLADLIYSGALANDGEILELRDSDDNLIDVVEAGEGWSAGDNETKQTMERKEDLDWQTSPNPGGTPRAKNSEEGQEEEEEEEGEEAEVLSGGGGSEPTEIKKEKPDIVINEIYPNPIGSDREYEFIELYSKGSQMADLTGWRLEDESGKVYEFGKFDSLFIGEINNAIRAGGYLVIFRSISGIVLNNSGGEIKLFSPDRKTAKQSLKYGEAFEGLSYINTSDIKIEDISTSTKRFLLNSTKVGDWVWTRKASPGRNNQVEPVNNPPAVDFSFPEKITSGQAAFFDSSDTVDEDGDDLSFSWDFGDGIELKAALPTHTFLEPGDYIVQLEVSDGKDRIFLERNIQVLGPFGQEEGVVSQEFSNNELSWIGRGEEYDYFERDFDLPLDFVNNYQEIAEVSLEEVKKLPLKTKVKTEGIVVVEPGTFGTQYFYIASSPALKIYNYKKDFPELALGDFIKVSGELSEAREEKYLKTKEAGDIEVLDNIETPLPEKIDSRALIEDNLGKLVEVEGEILEKKIPRIYLEDDFGEIVVYIKGGTKIDTKRIEQGNKIKIIGLLNKVSDEIVIMPRSDIDIILLESEEEGKIAGVEETEAEWSLPEKNKNSELFKYLIVLFFAIIIVLTVFLIKRKRVTD